MLRDYRQYLAGARQWFGKIIIVFRRKIGAFHGDVRNLSENRIITQNYSVDCILEGE